MITLFMLLSLHKHKKNHITYKTCFVAMAEITRESKRIVRFIIHDLIEG